MVTDAVMHDFVRVLVDIVASSTGALFSDRFAAICLDFVLTKNRGLEDFGQCPWPEDRLVPVTASYISELRLAERN